MQGISFLLAWITSDSKTELTENSSSLKHKFIKDIEIEIKASK